MTRNNEYSLIYGDWDTFLRIKWPIFNAKSTNFEFFHGFFFMENGNSKLDDLSGIPISMMLCIRPSKMKLVLDDSISDDASRENLHGSLEEFLFGWFSSKFRKNWRKSSSTTPPFWFEILFGNHNESNYILNKISKNFRNFWKIFEKSGNFSNS